MGREVRIPCSLKRCPSNDFNMVGDVVSSGDPNAFQHDNDIMQVVTPLSTTIQQIFFLRKPTMIWNASE